MTKLTVVFRNFAEAPKIMLYHIDPMYSPITRCTQNYIQEKKKMASKNCTLSGSFFQIITYIYI